MELGPCSDKPRANNSDALPQITFYSSVFSPPRADVATEVEMKTGQEHRVRESLRFNPSAICNFFFLKDFLDLIILKNK